MSAKSYEEQKQNYVQTTLPKHLPDVHFPEASLPDIMWLQVSRNLVDSHVWQT